MTVLYIREMCIYTSSNTSYLIESPKGGYSQLLSGRLQIFLTVSHWSTLWCNTPTIRPTQGVTTYILGTKRSTDCNTYLNKLTNTCVSAP